MFPAGVERSSVEDAVALDDVLSGVIRTVIVVLGDMVSGVVEAGEDLVVCNAGVLSSMTVVCVATISVTTVTSETVSLSVFREVARLVMGVLGVDCATVVRSAEISGSSEYVVSARVV